MNPQRNAAQDAAQHQDAALRPRSAWALGLLALCAGLMFAAFFALGTWQLKRLQWKLDLIERVDTRVHAPAAPAPGPGRWPQLNAASDEYRHVRVRGRFLYALTTPVQASTRLGSGFWLLTPLREADGSIVLVNRGFVAEKPAGGNRLLSPDKTPASTGDDDIVTVTGLLRMSEPGGAFLRDNDPIADRWYSRDVRAIAAARGLAEVAPYFVDADAAKPVDIRRSVASAANPVAGLTVISFRNNHLVYAITWYALALMVAAACVWVARDESRQWRLRHGSNAGAAGIGQGNEGASKN